MKRLVRIVAQGLALMLPLLITVGVVVWLATGAENLVGKPLEKHVLGDAYVPGMGIALAVVAAIVLGIVARFWLVTALVRWLEKLVRKIPLVKTLYGSVRDLLGFMSGQKKSFNRVVLVRMPGSDYWMVGFVTQESLEAIPGLADLSDRVAVYVAQSYNIGGAVLLVPRDQVREIDMGAEDAMRFALTAGVSVRESDMPLGAAALEEPPSAGPQTQPGG